MFADSTRILAVLAAFSHLLASFEAQVAYTLVSKPKAAALEKRKLYLPGKYRLLHKAILRWHRSNHLQ